MKCLIMILIFSPTLLFAFNDSRTIDTAIAKVSFKRTVRPEAEPASKPYQIDISVECHKPYKQVQKSFSFPICDTNLEDKLFAVTATEIQLMHYEWDGAQSTSNSQGKNYCLTNTKLKHKLKLSDFCKK